jgi:MYXO-CTERM domain-containing protein
MRKALAAVALTTALSTVPVMDSVSAQAPAQQADEDDDGGGKWGLLGLLGLLGLAGLAGLKRRDQYTGTGRTVSGTAPRTAEGATSSDPSRRP